MIALQWNAVLAARIPFALASLVLLWTSGIAAAAAASPLSAIAVGTSATYHLSTRSVKPAAGGGTTSTENDVRFTRAAVTTFNVTVDGLQAGQVTIGPSGNPNVPDSLKTIMAPFGLIGLLTRSAPQPIAPNSSWAATVPIPLNGQTSDVAAVVSVLHYSPSGATIVANGQNAASVKKFVRQKPADINFNASMTYDATHMLTGASSNVAVAIRAGALRTQNVSSSWTLTLKGRGP
jgi:hypothetical protein